MAYTLVKDLTTVNRTLGNSGRKYIVIHYTGNKTDTAKNNAAYFKSANRGVSAHYFVDGTTVYQVVDDADTAWAVGKNYGSGNLFNTVKNNNSISIEMCSTNGKISDATFENTVALTKGLMKKYGTPTSDVVRHLDVCSKQCPGWTGWTGTNPTIWNKFKSQLETVVAAASTTAKTTIKTMSVTAKSGLNVRKTYSVNSEKLGTLSYGDKVEVQALGTKWARITYKGGKGYVYKQYLK